MAQGKRVLMVGLGTIARTRLEVLERVPDLTVVGGVDPAAPVVDIPVFGTVDDALRSEPEPDLVVVATPTETHVALVRADRRPRPTRSCCRRSRWRSRL